MANVLLVTAGTTHAAYTRTKAAIEGQGHTVTGSLDNVTALDAAWAGGAFGAIAVVRATHSTSPPSPWQAWVRDKWAAGVPILIGGTENGTSTGSAPHAAESLGIISDAYVADSGNTTAADAASMRIVATHPITTGYATGANVQVLSSANYITYENLVTPLYGSEVGDIVPIGGLVDGSTVIAVDGGEAINGAGTGSPGSTAPARAVFCGWLYAGQSDYTADGKTILGQTVDWLTAGAPPVGTVITLAATATPASAAFTLSTPEPATEITLAATAQAATAAFTLTTSLPPAEVTLAGVASPATARFTLNQTGPVETSTRYANDGYNYTGTAEVDYEPPVAEPPAHIRRAKVRHVHQTMPAPTLVDGRPV